MGIALVDLNRLNANGPNHEYKTLHDFRTYLWQPVWLDAALKVDDEQEEEEIDEQANEIVIEAGSNDSSTGKPPGL